METNGISSKKYDLLSISLYKPDDQKIFNKFLPLQLNDRVLTTEYNGITDADLKGASHVTQEDLDKLIVDFDIKNRIVLHFGDLDKPFIKSYFKRNKLLGIENFNFFNFKQLIYSSSWQKNITKDNLCRIFEIDGVKSIHSGINDCILEWKLFEAIDNQPLIVINDDVYRFSPEYVLPVSELTYNKKLQKKLSNLPKLWLETEEIFSCKINADVVNFGSNISGISIEKMISSSLSAIKINNDKFLTENKSKMKYLGSLPNESNKVYTITDKNGQLISLTESDEDKINKVNQISKNIQNECEPLFDYLQKNIFASSPVFSQELVINKELKLLALCDFSNEHAVLEVKMGKNINLSDFRYQIFVQSNNRPCYFLIMDWNKKILKLLKVIFLFGEEAEKEEIIQKKASKENKAQELQKNFFDEKMLRITKFNGVNCNSCFECLQCNKSFEIKFDLTFDNIKYYLKCPYCYPSAKPPINESYDIVSYSKIKTTLKRRKINIYNWISKKEIYLECQKCKQIWEVAEKDILNKRCPKCSKIRSKKKGTSF